MNDQMEKRMNRILVVHSSMQDSDICFWRMFVPSDPDTKERIMQELHSTLYSAHPGIQVSKAVFLLESNEGGTSASLWRNARYARWRNLTTHYQRANCSPPRFQKRNGVKSPLTLWPTCLSPLVCLSSNSLLDLERPHKAFLKLVWDTSNF